MTEASKSTAAKDPAMNATKLSNRYKYKICPERGIRNLPNHKSDLLVGELSDVHASQRVRFV